MQSHSDPEGYKKLLVYTKADELHGLTLRLADEIKWVEREKRVKGDVTHSSPLPPSTPFNKILLELADQMGRAARSPKSNIVEGWKRNSTAEYYEFLGFSIASTEEIREDCEDIIKGKYGDLLAEMGKRGVKGKTGQPLSAPSAHSTPSPPYPHSTPLTLDQVKGLPFYPLPPLLPLVVEVYLRSRELGFLLDNLQKSLEDKMREEGTLPMRQKLKNRKQEQDEADRWLREEIERRKPANKGE